MEQIVFIIHIFILIILLQPLLYKQRENHHSHKPLQLRATKEQKPNVHSCIGKLNTIKDNAFESWIFFHIK